MVVNQTNNNNNIIRVPIPFFFTFSNLSCGYDRLYPDPIHCPNPGLYVSVAIFLARVYSPDARIRMIRCHGYSFSKKTNNTVLGLLESGKADISIQRAAFRLSRASRLSFVRPFTGNQLMFITKREDSREPPGLSFASLISKCRGCWFLFLALVAIQFVCNEFDRQLLESSPCWNNRNKTTSNSATRGRRGSCDIQTLESESIQYPVVQSIRIIDLNKIQAAPQTVDDLNPTTGPRIVDDLIPTTAPEIAEKLGSGVIKTDQQKTNLIQRSYQFRCWTCSSRKEKQSFIKASASSKTPPNRLSATKTDKTSRRLLAITDKTSRRQLLLYRKMCRSVRTICSFFEGIIVAGFAGYVFSLLSTEYYRTAASATAASGTGPSDGAIITNTQQFIEALEASQVRAVTTSKNIYHNTLLRLDGPITPMDFRFFQAAKFNRPLYIKAGDDELFERLMSQKTSTEPFDPRRSSPRFVWIESQTRLLELSYTFPELEYTISRDGTLHLDTIYTSPHLRPPLIMDSGHAATFIQIFKRLEREALMETVQRGGNRGQKSTTEIGHSHDGEGTTAGRFRIAFHKIFGIFEVFAVGLLLAFVILMAENGEYFTALAHRILKK